MLYLSYNLNFTPSFLLIKDTSWAPNLLITMVTGQTVTQPRSLTRCGADQREGGKKGRRSEMRGGSEVWRKYELSMCREQMENYYFMVIVGCLILNCKNELLIFSIWLMFDEWNRDRGGSDFREGIWRKVTGHSKSENKDTTWKCTAKKIHLKNKSLHFICNEYWINNEQTLRIIIQGSDWWTWELLGQKDSSSLVDRINNLEKQPWSYHWGFYC